MIQPTEQIRENPNKRPVSPPAGDRPLDEMEVLKTMMRVNDALVRSLLIRCRRQKLELRRLNRVIQQMSWKLHRRMRPQIFAATSGLVVGLIIGVVLTAAIAALVLS